MNFKRYFYITLNCILLSLLVIVVTVVVVDPYQQYRQSELYMSNQRLSNPGIAKTQDYDAVIVGSSMAMNHYPSQLDSLFGWNTINLTTMGGTDEDYKLLFPHMIRQGKLKYMVLALDFFSFSSVTTHFTSETYLYDDKWWNDYPYWLGYTSCTNTFNKIMGRKMVSSRDSLYHFNSPSGRKYVHKYYEDCNNEKYLEKYDFSKMETRFDDLAKEIMPLLSDVDVYIYFPPYSILEFCIVNRYNYLPQLLNFKEYMIEKLLQYPNVKLYDFQKEEFICNLDEYMDLRHHSHVYNKRIIEYIHKDSCRVSEDNYKKDLAVLDSLVKHYRLND